MKINVIENAVTKSYVVEGARLKCNFGSTCSTFKIPIGHGVYIRDKKQGNTDDYKTLFNIFPFGLCSCTGGSCMPSVIMPWIGGKDSVTIATSPALLNTSIAICSLSGIIRILDDGQE